MRKGIKVKGASIWQQVNFTIHKGDFVGIMGASGAGKTTFAGNI